MLAQSNNSRALRYDWMKSEVQAIYETPLPELVYRAQTVHREFHKPDRVQTCQLISIKTGGCPEDCAYCPQSAHYDADVERQGLLDPEHVISVARDAASRATPALSRRARKRSTAEAITSPGRCRRACCRPRSPTFHRARWRSGSPPRAPATSSAVTSTTCSTSETITGRS